MALHERTPYAPYVWEVSNERTEGRRRIKRTTGNVDEEDVPAGSK